MYEKLFPARLVCRGSSKLMTQSATIIEDIVSDCGDTDQVLNDVWKKMKSWFRTLVVFVAGFAALFVSFDTRSYCDNIFMNYV